MATDTRAELDVSDFILRDGGLEEFEPEDQRGGSSRRVPSPTVADVQRWQPRVDPPRAQASSLVLPLVISDEQRWQPRVNPPRSRVWLLVLPVVISAALAGAAMWWLSTEIPHVDPAVVAVKAGPDRSTATVAPDRSAATEAAAEPATPSSATVPDSTVPASTAAPAPSIATAPTVPTEPVHTPKDPAFEQTLAEVSRAYRALDAAAVAAVLPNTDSAALAQAFSELKYQALSFDRCAVRPNGAESAVASCDVSLAMAPKSGQGAMLRRHEAWTLVLNRSGEAWRIAAVTRR